MLSTFQTHNQKNLIMSLYPLDIDACQYYFLDIIQVTYFTSVLIYRYIVPFLPLQKLFLGETQYMQTCICTSFPSDLLNV